MTGDRRLRSIAERAAARGAAPSLRDFEVALTEARCRRRRRGRQSAGAALAAVVVVVAGWNGISASTTASDEVQFVDAPAPHQSTAEGLLPTPARLGAPPSSTADPAAQDVHSRDAVTPAGSAVDPDLTSRPRPPAPAGRSSTSTSPLLFCGGDTEWCLRAQVRPAGAKGYTLYSTMCANARTALPRLDFTTAQETDFELLSGSRVIWRWSDGQAFARTPHQLSALPGGCFTWQTVWDQYDGQGDRVGKARLTLRVRALATQRTEVRDATVVFVTTKR